MSTYKIKIISQHAFLLVTKNEMHYPSFPFFFLEGGGGSNGLNEYIDGYENIYKQDYNKYQ